MKTRLTAVAMLLLAKMEHFSSFAVIIHASDEITCAPRNNGAPLGIISVRCDGV